MAEITYKDSRGIREVYTLTNGKDFFPFLEESSGGLSHQKGVTKWNTLGGEGADFQTFLSESTGSRPQTDHIIMGEPGVHPSIKDAKEV